MMTGEPSGTAGSPILKIILEQNLSNVLIVVTRYFGGILLGTGGLVRAYSSSAKLALEQVNYIKKIKGFEVKVYLEYESIDQFKYYANKNNIKIAKIEIIVEMTEEKLSEFTNINSKKTFNIIKYDILKEKYIDI